jgi:hypothetical protein
MRGTGPTFGSSRAATAKAVFAGAPLAIRLPRPRVDALGRYRAIRSFIWALRLAPVRPPITTATIERSRSITDDTRLKPDARV